MTIYHKHHIIPKHMGGTDDPSNLIYLTIEEHAEAHKKLWEKHGHWQDELAYKGLSKLISKDEIILEVSVKANLGKTFSTEHKEKISKALKNHSVSEETRKKISNTRRQKNIPSPRKNASHTDEAKQLLSLTAKNRKKITCSCGKTVDVSNFGRWHKNCNHGFVKR